MQQMVPCQKQTLQFNDMHLNHKADMMHVLANIYVHVGTLSTKSFCVYLSISEWHV